MALRTPPVIGVGASAAEDARPVPRNRAGKEGCRMETTQVHEIVQAQRDFFKTGATKDIDFRREQLSVLKRAVNGNTSSILKALKEDMNKPAFEAYVAEVSQVTNAIDYALKRLAWWARPRRVHTPAFLFLAGSYVYPEPVGVALIIAPWNYPLDLVMEPLVGAIAAGNCAVLKPSEIAPATSAVTARIVKDHFDPAFVTAIEGGPAETQALLAEQFDYIFYTGGSVVGKIIMEAAAKNLTPVTLELGGKSPCIVEPDIDLDITARRITWGKYFNAGQTCIAPDYLLVNRRVKDDLLEGIKGYIKRFYGDDPKASPDYARIVSDKHFERISRLMDEGDVVVGGQTEAGTRYIAPTVIDNVKADHKIMQEEIFGPVLPVIAYDDLQEAIDIVTARPKPLSLYVFTRDRVKKQRVLRDTTSGGGCVNDTMVHYSNQRLPFGGVGMSGSGRYHGKWTFDTFSNMKSIVDRSFLFDVYLRYPPYKNAQKLAQRFLRYVT
jgi:aldehyde dehydrogenase (NAD+)